MNGHPYVNWFVLKHAWKYGTALSVEISDSTDKKLTMELPTLKLNP